jgi:hypothetical protein
MFWKEMEAHNKDPVYLKCHFDKVIEMFLEEQRNDKAKKDKQRKKAKPKKSEEEERTEEHTYYLKHEVE